MQRLKAKLDIEDFGRVIGTGYCRACKRPVIEHVGEACMFDFTELDASPIDRVLAGMWQGKSPRDAVLTLGIPGVAAVTYVVKASSYKWSVTHEPDYFELGRLSPSFGRKRGSLLELELVGVGQ
jgi:hypothetical protein